MKEYIEENLDSNSPDDNIFNINNIISTKPEKKEIISDNIIPIGPRMKYQKKNKKEDIELQIACEDAEERKERLMLEKQKKKEQLLKNKNLIYKIDEDNYYCVDCGNPQSNFISINNGVTLCNNCAEIHKTFGNNISYILNINDKLDDYLFNFFVFGSNTKFKRFLEKEKFDNNINIKKKYKINSVVFYRINLKNKVEGKQMEIKNYENPNDICENICMNEYSKFDEYTIKKGLIKNGELIKESKFIIFMNNFFFGSKKVPNKNKVLIRKKSTVKENLVQNKGGNDNNNNNRLNINVKRYPNALNFESDKIKESSRPFANEKTEQDKSGEIDETPRIYNTSEQMVNNNKIEKEK